MENELFLLRKPLKDKDVNDLFHVKNNKETAKFLGGNTPIYSLKDIENWIDFHNNCPNEELFVIQDKQRDKIIGHIGLYKIDLVLRSAEYAILIGDNDYIGKGVGSQITKIILNFAFDILLLNKISLSLISENKVAYNLYSKIGFKVEGCHKNAILKNGVYYDSVLMAISKDEYDKK